MKEIPEEYKSEYVKRPDVQGHLKVMECLRKWDPIGVINDPNWPDNEYDGYSAAIVHMLDSGVSKKDLLKHLKKICIENIGIGFDKVKTEKIVDEMLAFWKDWKVTAGIKSPALNGLEWRVLEGISYDEDEPFEVVDGIVKSYSTLDANDTLEIIFGLYSKDFVYIRQAPLKPLSQHFDKKTITPGKPVDVVGDLIDDFLKYSKKREYLEKMNDTGIPFGIYIGLTEKAKNEIKKDAYKKYAR